MFISLRGLKQSRLIVNTDHVRAFQEITPDSKYADYLTSGAHTMAQIDDKVVPVKDSIIQIKNIINKMQQEQFGGA